MAELFIAGDTAPSPQAVWDGEHIKHRAGNMALTLMPITDGSTSAFFHPEAAVLVLRDAPAVLQIGEVDETGGFTPATGLESVEYWVNGVYSGPGSAFEATPVAAQNPYVDMHALSI